MPSGSKPGERRGGRQAGTPNRKTVEAQRKLDEIGCDPLEGMAKIAMDESNSIELRASMFRELARYTPLKRRPAELSGDVALTFEQVVIELYYDGALTEVVVH